MGKTMSPSACIGMLTLDNNYMLISTAVLLDIYWHYILPIHIAKYSYIQLRIRDSLHALTLLVKKLRRHLKLDTFPIQRTCTCTHILKVSGKSKKVHRTIH